MPRTQMAPVLQTESRGPLTRIRTRYRVLGVEGHSSSSFLVDGLLVDTCAPVAVEPFVEWCRDRPIDLVALTHHHEDHAGAGAALRRSFGLRILCPEEGLPVLEAGPRIPLYRRVLMGVTEAFRAEPLGASVRCGGRTWRVIPTPGHAFDHVCLFEEGEGWLATGDLFVAERAMYLRQIEDVWEHIDSLERVARLDPDLLLCSQAGFVEDGARALRRKIDYWMGLAGEARRLHDRGLDRGEIARRLLGPEGPFTYMSTFEFSKRRLVDALLEPPAVGSGARANPVRGPF